MTASPRRIGLGDPTVSAIHDRLETIAACAAILFVTYVTCFPAVGSNAPSNPITSDTPQVTALGLSLQDIVQNVLLYLPVGLFGTLALRSRKVRWPWIMPLVLVGSTLLAQTAETLQNTLPGRVSSRHDVLCNTGGAALGLLIAVAWRNLAGDLKRSLVERTRRLPVSCCCTVVGLAYAGAALVPFELDLTPTGDAHVFNARQLTAVTPARAAILWQELELRARVDRWLDIAAAATTFVVLGGMSWWSLRREYRFRRAGALLMMLWLVVTLTAATLALQLFVRHAGFSALCATVNPASALVGAALAAVLGRWATRNWPWLCAGTALVCLAFITARELNPFLWAWSSVDIEAFAWIPLQRSFDGVGPLHASSDLMARGARFTVLAVCLGAWLVGRRSAASRDSLWQSLGMVLAGCVVVAVVLEFLQLAQPDRSADITHVIVACLSTTIGLLASAWWMALVLSSRDAPSPVGVSSDQDRALALGDPPAVAALH